MRRVLHRKCTRCELKYELYQYSRYNPDIGDYDEPVVYALTAPDPTQLTCPRCNATAFVEVMGTPNLQIGRADDASIPYGVRAPNCGETGLRPHHFPYFDAGLGVMLESIEHREYLKTHYKDGVRREPGAELVWVGDELPFDPASIVDHQISHRRETEAKYTAYKQEMLAVPETAYAWNYVETCLAAKDFSTLGVEFPEPLHYPPEGEQILQDLDGYLYTASGWSSDQPQPWVPLALMAAGHPPALPDRERDLVPEQEYEMLENLLPMWKADAQLSG